MSTSVVVLIWGVASLLAVTRGISNVRSARIYYVKAHPTNGLGRIIASTAWRTQVALLGMSSACLGVVGVAVISGDTATTSVSPQQWLVRLLVLLVPVGLAIIGEWQHRLMRYVDAS